MKFLGTVFIACFGLLPALNASTPSAFPNNDQPQQKVHTVKVLTQKDGKLTESDSTIVTSKSKGAAYYKTTLTQMADSIYHNPGADVKTKQVTVVVTEDKDDKGGSHTYTYTIGDTLQSDVAQKVVRLGDGKKMIIMKSEANDNFSSSDMNQAGPERIIVRKLRDPFAFDATDPGIVSYKKKDIGKGQERITIVRKKVVTE